VFRDRIRSLEERGAAAESAEFAAFLAGWQAHSDTDPEVDTMGLRPQTPEAAFRQWKGLPSEPPERDSLNQAFDLLADARWQDALDAFRQVLADMQGNDPLGLIEDQMAFCQAMLDEQKRTR